MARTMTNTQKSGPRPIGAHVYIYCWIAILLLGAAAFIIPGVAVLEYVSIETTTLVACISCVLYFGALWFALRRCSSADLSGSRGLLIMTAYMTVGIGGFSMLIAIPAVLIGILACLGVSAVSLFRDDPAFAAKQFRRLVLFYHRHRMYQ